MLKKLGATVVEAELLKQIGSFSKHELNVLKYEFRDGLNQDPATAGAQIKSLEDVIQFNKEHEMPWFKQELLEQCQALGGLDSPEYQNALKNTLGTRAIIDKLMLDNKLNALCGTSIGPVCCIDLVNGDSVAGFYFCSPAAMAGYPHITVPMGRVHELPMGFSFVSRAWDELNLLHYAYAFEQGDKIAAYLRPQQSGENAAKHFFFRPPRRRIRQRARRSGRGHVFRRTRRRGHQN